MDVETEKRLRKDLKRTKALLADAQIMLDHMKNNAPSKREIAQLKNQVPAPPTLRIHSFCYVVHSERCVRDSQRVGVGAKRVYGTTWR